MYLQRFWVCECLVDLRSEANHALEEMESVAVACMAADVLDLTRH